MQNRAAVLCLIVLTLCPSIHADAPAPPAEMAPWHMPWGAQVPGAMSADSLIASPAGKAGGVIARDGHFFTGSQRLRFFGANIAFSGAFPTHDQADKVAHRLARFGFNCIRFHHMDMQPFPNGIFADEKLEKLSPEALDRLDYFVAALKVNGIYSDLNLHVSRSWAKSHHWPNSDQMPEFDKMVDLFNPELMAANQQYARDLLTHFNPYTHSRYADEPAVAFIEINNEDTLFLWGGETKLADLPEPYAGQLQTLWNQWLLKKYQTRAALASAWSQGAQPAGPNLLRDSGFLKIGSKDGWYVEQHESAKMTATPELNEDTARTTPVRLNISAVDGTAWHLQFNQAPVAIRKGQYYTLQFEASADEPVDLTAGLQQAHEPWQSLGLGETVTLGKDWKTYRLGFVGGADENSAKFSLLVGRKTGTIHLAAITLHEGDQITLAPSEDPARSTVSRGGPRQGATAARSRDWYDFLQQTDEAHFTAMRKFLREDLGVKCPITGTIGLGPLGTRSESTMDFVDAHVYWDHPQFPHRSWDARDWIIDNKPMVDDPARAALLGLAATRVAGKPLTVTEYNHAAPNEWQAECMPLLATYAALQDWDGLFLFAYSHSNQYEEKDRAVSFFDIEGNPQKMGLAPLASRLFLSGQLHPLSAQRVIVPERQQMLDTASAYFYNQWAYLRDTQNVTWQDTLHQRISLSFNGELLVPQTPGPASDPAAWTSQGEGSYTGRFVLADPAAAAFVGFAKGPLPINAGALWIEKLDTPFATLMLIPADSGKTIDAADRLLLAAVARGGNTGMKWDAARHSVNDQWGAAPPLIEVVGATLSIAGPRPLTTFALTPEGTRGAKLPSSFKHGRTVIELGSEKTIWYELVR
jgi:Carbohydrate binding domain/Cellulase (glycosyl hydrolase family 5)